VILRALLQNENTLLRSELHFLAGMKWAEMEDLYHRAWELTQFSLGCVSPEERSRRTWEGILAEYKVTAGVLGRAIGDRLAAADSADQRNRAIEVRKDATELLREGYQYLKKHRDDDRQELAASLLWQRMFTVSDWEDSCLLAERAMPQLTE